LLKHEKSAFWKFFFIYFGSVAFLILAAGYFYFGEQKKALVQQEHFSMIEHIRKLKMDQHEIHVDGIVHEVIHKKIENFNINNFIIKENYFEAYIPYDWKDGYFLVKKDKSDFHSNLFQIKIRIIAMQLFLLFLFALISYFLSLRALKPMQEAIVKLDNFSKDLIHDLNTPVTSILLNTKILERSELKGNKALGRIKQSAGDIGELHNNLTLLLQEDTMVMSSENICEIMRQVVTIQEKIYPDITIDVQNRELIALVNADALKQVFSNILSNAGKYNKENGYIKIYSKENLLCIEDGGIGIEKPELIFNRSYKEHTAGHGIGLDIAKRLCEVMQIKISASSKVGQGTSIYLEFNV